MQRLIAAVLLATGVLVLGGSLPATAHQGRPAERATGETAVTPRGVILDEPRPSAFLTAAPSPPFKMAGALVMLATMLVVLGSRHRVLAPGLALVTLVLNFESGVHSVHHLGSSEESKCAVAVAATHVQGTVGELVVEPTEPVPVGAVPTVAQPRRPGAQAWRAWRGRAPPSFPIG